MSNFRHAKHCNGEGNRLPVEKVGGGQQLEKTGGEEHSEGASQEGARKKLTHEWCVH